MRALLDNMFRSIIEYSASDVVVIDTDGRLLWSAPAAHEMGILGYDAQTLIRSDANVFDLVHADDLATMKGCLDETVGNPGTPIRIACRIRNAEGEWRYVNGYATNRLEDPDVTGVVINYQDVTELARSGERQRILLSTLSDLAIGIVIVQGDRILSANTAFAEMIGYTVEELVASGSMLDLLKPSDRATVQAQIRTVDSDDLDAGVVSERIETVLVRRDGATVHVEIRHHSVAMEHDSQRVLIVQDISERREADKARREEIARVQAENVSLRRRLGSAVTFESMVGKSEAIQRVCLQIRAVTESPSPPMSILIRGETGVGKELVAQAIHANGARRKGPFVPVDCPAIAGDLFGSELFGHERGAFTGATERRIGKFELAQGGTLFLDEVTEIEPILQAKLLRVLQERVIHRVGGDKPIPVDVQIIAATNRDVIAAIEAGEFRRDLYYRLLGFDEIVVPPLRERREDIPLLAEHFLRQHADSGSVTKTFISQEAMDLLVMIDWEGNVRELKGAIESAAIWANREGTTIHPRHLPTRYSTSRPTLPMHSSGDTLRDRLNEMERWMIQGALSAANHNIAAAARELGMDPSNLRRRMSTLAIIT